MPKPKPPAHDAFTAIATQQLHTPCVKEHRFHPTRRWRFDYALPAHRIALEVEGGVWTGGRHTRPRGFLRDMEKYNSAAAMGWRIIRCTPSTLYDNATLQLLQAAINERHTAQETEITQTP